MRQWSQPTTNTMAYCRAGARRRLNAERQMAATLRRQKVLYWYQRWRDLPGVRALLAYTFSLHRSTIDRYLRDIEPSTANAIGCPTCGAATEKTCIRNISTGDFPPEVRTHQRVGRPRAIKKRNRSPGITLLKTMCCDNDFR